MYAWSPPGVFGGIGFPCEWDFIVVWIDNPDLEALSIQVAIVQSRSAKLERYAPVGSKCIEGTSLKVKYKHKWLYETFLEITKEQGGYHELMTREQPSDASKTALINIPGVPFTDVNFESDLNASWPF